MTFHIITIFPKIFDTYFNESILKRAKEKGLVTFNVHNLRDYTADKHKTVDDTPYGGGAGMVLKIEPIFRAVNALNLEREATRIILLSAKGKRYTQKDAKRLAGYGNLVFICGRYEGVDERVAQNIADEEISIGDYVLTGGELGAMAVVDSVSRLLPEVLGNKESIETESHSEDGYLEYPQYTKPEVFEGWEVPKILLEGNHAKIEEWRKENSKRKE